MSRAGHIFNEENPAAVFKTFHALKLNEPFWGSLFMKPEMCIVELITPERNRIISIFKLIFISLFERMLTPKSRN